MALKGVCTSPNGVIGCTSPTCPGSSFNNNLESFRFYVEDFNETKKHGTRDEWDSLEINLSMAVDGMLEDYLVLDVKSREDIRANLTPEEVEIMKEYGEEYNAAEIFDATSSFSIHDLSSIEDAYLEAAFWTEEENLDGLSANNMDDETHLSVTKDIMHFLSQNKELVQEALQYTTPEQIGHDLWFTRNGHGTGYWDRQELKNAGISDKLTEAAKQMGSKNLLAADGNVYFE